MRLSTTRRFLLSCRFSLQGVALLARFAGCTPEEAPVDDSPDALPPILTPVPTPGGGGGADFPGSPRLPEADADLPRTLAASCWSSPGSWCDPRNAGAACGEGESCDLTVEDGLLVIDCLAGRNLAALGSFCDNREGIFCAPNLHCYQGRCRAFCCEASTCDRDELCGALVSRAGTLGVCRPRSVDPFPQPGPDGGNPPPPTPTCGRQGAQCLDAFACCSRICSSGRCQ
jgi:hypothetical protein